MEVLRRVRSALTTGCQAGPGPSRMPARPPAPDPAALGLMSGIQLAAVNRDPLLHTQQPVAGPASVGHPAASVDHLQAQLPLGVPKDDLGARPASVASPASSVSTPSNRRSSVSAFHDTPTTE